MLAFGKLGVGLIAVCGSLFSMCDRGPVPNGCCKHGDQLDVVYSAEEMDWVGDCLDSGGRPVVRRNPTLRVCEDVDF